MRVAAALAAVVAVAAVGVGVYFVAGGGGEKRGRDGSAARPPSVQPATGGESVELAPDRRVSGSGNAAAQDGRERTPTTQPPPDSPAIEPIDLTLRGSVRDRSGAPAAGATLRIGHRGSWQELGTLGADGRFSHPWRADRAAVHLRLDPPWRLVGEVPATPGAWREPWTLLADRLGALDGVVLGPDGDPLVGVEVHYRAPGRFYSHTERVSLQVGGQTVSDLHGRFRIETAPALPETSVASASQLYDPAEVPAHVDDPGQVVLRLDYRADYLTGRVFGPANNPLAARVVLGSRRTDAHPETGEFTLDLRWFAPLDEPLVASAPGFAPEVREGVGERFLELGRRHPPLTLQLRPAGRIAGRVLGPSGSPVPDAHVSVLDATEAYGEYAEAHASPRGMLTVPVEADGSFLLDGLAHKRYTLAAVDPATLVRVERELSPDRDDVVLRLPALSLQRTVQGRLSYLDGSPATGFSVSAFVELPGRPGEDHRFARRVNVAEDGGFLIEELPDQDLELGIGGGLDPERVPLPRATSHLDLTVYRRCLIVVEWPVDVAPPQFGSARTASGEELPLYAERWGVFRETTRLNFVDPRDEAGEWQSASVFVPEHATVLALRRDGAEILRLALQPVPGKKTFVRP